MNVIFICVDALRWDKIGVVSDSNNSLTPNMDKLAKKGTIFLNHVTVQNASAPSQASIFTGLYPTTHGVRENGVSLPKNLKTMAEYFKEDNYTTCGAVGGGTLGSVYNFNKGFDYFFDNSKYDKLMHICSRIGGRRYNLRKVIKKMKLFDVFGTPYNVTNKKVLTWLDSHYKEKFFLFVHYFDIHRDTFSKENKNTKIQSREGRYNENAKIVDRAIGELINKLMQLRIFEDSMIIITSDHGEDLEGEANIFGRFLDKAGVSKIGHGRKITEGQFRTPLIIYKPQLIPQKKIKEFSRSIDLLPTLLSIINIKQNEQIDGEDLKDSIFKDKEIAKEIFLESYPVFGDIKGIRTKEWLYILTDGEKEELYDVNRDSDLKKDVSDNNKKIAIKFKVRVKKHFSIPYEEGERDEYTMDMLRELGYTKEDEK